MSEEETTTTTTSITVDKRKHEPAVSLATEEQIQERISFLYTKFDVKNSATRREAEYYIPRWNAPIMYAPNCGTQAPRAEIEAALTLGYQIISSEHRWTTVFHTIARDLDGSPQPTDNNSPRAECFCTIAACGRAGFEIVSKELGKPVNLFGYYDHFDAVVMVDGKEVAIAVNPHTIADTLRDVLDLSTRFVSDGESASCVAFNDQNHWDFVREFMGVDTSEDDRPDAEKEREYTSMHHAKVREVWETAFLILGLPVPEPVDNGVTSLYALWRRTFSPLSGVFAPLRLVGEGDYSNPVYETLYYADPAEWITV